MKYLYTRALLGHLHDTPQGDRGSGQQEGSRGRGRGRGTGRGRGRGQSLGHQSATPSLVVSGPSTETTEKRRGPGRPRKVAVDTTTTASTLKSTDNLPSPSMPRNDSESLDDSDHSEQHVVSAVPRKRGRPPRVDLPATHVNIVIQKHHTTMEEPPVKKPRGRPPKHPQSETQTATLSEPHRGPGRPPKHIYNEMSASSSPEPHRGPGRPPKHIYNEMSASSSSEPRRGPGRPRKHPEAIVSSVPKRRGRPPKHIYNEMSTSSSSEPHRGPGRPPKQPVDAASPPAPDRSPKHIYNEMSTPSSSEPRRGPGRPRKHPEAVVSSVPKRRGRPPKLATETHLGQTLDIVPKRRGRPPKHAADSTQTLDRVPKRRGRPPKHLSHSNDSTTSELMVPRRPGRPPKNATIPKRPRGRPPKISSLADFPAPRRPGRPPKNALLPKRRGRPPLHRAHHEDTMSVSSQRSWLSEEESEDEEHDERDAAPLMTAEERIEHWLSSPSKQLPLSPDHLLDATFKPLYRLANDTTKPTECRIHACEWEPARQGQYSRIMAVAYGNAILFMDPERQRFEKKYAHPEKNEEFFCLAWTSLQGPKALLDDHAAEEDGCTILAAAGHLGSIKLINPLQNECYRYLFGHQKTVTRLVFAKANPRWLFSASADLSIRLWDIGSPSNTSNSPTCLARFTLPTHSKVPTSLSLSIDMSMLIAGCSNGDMARYDLSDKLIQSLSRRRASIRTLKPSMVYPSGDEWHEGSVEDIHILGQDGDTSHPLFGFVVSRGVEDEEILVWNPKTSTPSEGDIWYSFEWPVDEQEDHPLRFKMIESDGSKVLLAGDDQGSVHMFVLGSDAKSTTLQDGSIEQTKASQLIKLPNVHGRIVDLAVSDDMHWLVALDDSNRINACQVDKQID